MKIKILNTSKTEVGSADLPSQFSEPVRKDLIERAFMATQSAKIQPYGSSPGAGLRASAEISRRRRKYRGSYGFGISRVPRKIMSRRGTRMVWVGAVMPGTVGGRRAHPPKASKCWTEAINKKERRKAIRSAMAATLDRELVSGRGHKVPANYPFIIKDDLAKIEKTKEMREKLSKLGFEDEMERTSKKKASGLLVVTSGSNLTKALSNLKGFDCIDVKDLCVEKLAPGGVPGRLTLFTEAAIKDLSEKKLFTQNFKGESSRKDKKVSVNEEPKNKPKKAKPKAKAKSKAKPKTKTSKKSESKIKPKTKKTKKDTKAKK